jgi:membrane-bound lytic murein transglycosylase F
LTPAGGDEHEDSGHVIGALFRWIAFAYGRGRALTAAVLLPAVLLAPSFGGGLLGEVRARGALRVVTLNSPTTYYQGREGPAGPEYDLAKAYADHLGVDLEVIVRASIAEVLEAADTGDADIAAAGLTITERSLLQRRFAPAYDTVREIVVCREGGPAPADLGTLDAAEIVVAEASSYAATLLRLEAQGHAVRWREEPGASVDALIEDVSAGRAQCTLADDHQLDLSHRYYGGVVAAVSLPVERRLAWAVGEGRSWRSASLESDLRRWFGRRATRELVASLNERYFGFSPESVEPAHAAAFRRAMEIELPRYRDLFESEAERAGIPWTLLAAVAYQESHWDPDARSPTGVRGMMMLTLPTARALGIPNRLDPLQSTRGGARYLKRLRDRMPETITGEDRWWFAAASYNLGWGHVMDARALAARRGLNPNHWSEVRDVLPLLEDPAFNADLRYGFARGREGQTYVRRVRDFADMLEKRFDDVAPIEPDPTQLAANTDDEGEATN